MRQKRLPTSDADAGDPLDPSGGSEEEPAKRPRTRFVELQPAAEDPADGIDEEIPGSVRAGVEPLVLGDQPFDAYSAGDPALTASHAAADPGFARAQRALLRQQRQEGGALQDALKAQEKYDQPEEAVNEAGDPIEPFHLRKEQEEGYFDPSGHYLEYAREEETDAWLDSIEDQVHGTGPGSSRRLPYPNEPVAEPPPLPAKQLGPYWRCLQELLQPGETVPAALRRLAGAGPVLDKFASKEEASRFFQERVRSGHAVPPGNHEEFQALTEAAEVLFDHGATNLYSLIKEQLHQAARKQAEAEKAPPAAAPSRLAAAEAAALVGGAGAAEEDGMAVDGEEKEEAGPAAGRGRRQHRGPPAASPAAASEPPISADKPSVPSGERTAATTRGGAGVGAATHGFAAQLPEDVLAEMAATALPPQEMEVGLGQLSSAPTEVELQRQAALLPPSLPGQAASQQAAKAAARGQLHQQHAAAMPEGMTPMKAALYGSFSDRVPPAQQEATAADMAAEARIEMLGAAGRLPVPAAAGEGGAAASGQPGTAEVADEVADEQLEAAFQQAARPGQQETGRHSAGRHGPASMPPSAAATVGLLGGMVQPAAGGGPAAMLAGRLGSVERLVAEEEEGRAQDANRSAAGATEAQPATTAPKGGPVAFDNESANLVTAGAAGGPGGQQGRLEE